MDDFPYLTEAISRVLTRLRTAAGLSKRKLALLSGIDRVYLLQVEQGKYRPTVNFMFLFAQAVGVSPGALFTLIEQEQKSLAQENGRAQ